MTIRPKIAITMNNEIGRKLTSLTLLSLLLASGITFAAPGAMPSAEAAHNANLFVSAENSQFNNYIAGPQVIEVVVNDADLKDLDDAQGEPDVTVNGKKIRMAQATDGNWYAYFADRTQAMRADNTQPAGKTVGKGLNFGLFCDNDDGDLLAGASADISISDTVGIAIPESASVAGGSDSPDADGAIADCTGTNIDVGSTGRVMNVIRENKTLNKGVAGDFDGQIGLTTNAWPFIQLYDLSVGGNVVVKYAKSASNLQTTTLTFDTIPSNLISTSLDRSTYPQDSEIHVTLADPQLNIDPTDEDSWTFNANSTTPLLFYQAFDENGASDAAFFRTAVGAGTFNTTTMQNIDGNRTLLNFEKNGRLTINLAAQGSTVAQYEDNDDQIRNSTLTNRINAAITFVETGPSSGIFTNFDELDNSNIDVTTSALRGQSATIRYNDVSQSIVVGFGFATLSIDVADGEWNSGEEVPVTLVDTDANKNSRSDEDLDLNANSTSLIPTLRIGKPFTLDAPGVTTEDAALLDAVVLLNTATAAELSLSNGWTQIGTASLTIASFSDVGTVSVTSGVTSVSGKGALAIELSRNIDNLEDSITDPRGSTGLSRFHGFNFFNFDLRSIATDAGITSISAYLLVNRTGTGNTALDVDSLDAAIVTRGDIVAISIGNTTTGSKAALINLNETSAQGTGSACADTSATGCAVNPALFSASNSDSDDIGLLFVFNPTTAISFPAGSSPIVADFFSFGYTGDGTTVANRTNSAIYRFELEETGDNTSTFAGSAEFTMLNQISILNDTTYEGLRTIDDEVTFIVHEDLDAEESPRISYLDKGSDGVSTQISAQEDAGTHSALVSFDKDTYKTADTVTVTLEDADLNVDSDLIDIFSTVSTSGDPAVDTVGGASLPTLSDGTALGRLLDITFDDIAWATDTSCGTAPDDTGLADSGFTLVETGAETGIFKGDFQVPPTFCRSASATSYSTTNGVDMEVNYVDFRDASGNSVEIGDASGVRAHTGSISLDRTVYPVPFGDASNFASSTSESPSGRSLFPVHATATSGALGSGETLGTGLVTIHVQVNDPDEDVSAAGEDKIDTDTAAAAVGPVKVIVSRGSSKVVLAYAGGPSVDPGVIDVSDNNATETRELGPITETTPSSGIFEFDLDIAYTDGPANTSCPTTTTYSAINGSSGSSYVFRFDVQDSTNPNKYCILQGDILTVEYTDPSDASGDVNTVTDSASFDLRNGVIQSDKSVYIIGADMILTLIEPDLDLDSDETESYDLDLFEWDSDAAEITIGNLGGNASKFDPEPSEIRETGDNTGIFQVVLEIPDVLTGNRLDRGEEIQLEYTDWGPSGADFVGDENEDINLTIYTSNFGATVELDQKVYTWTDKVFMTVVAPDHNFDSALIDEIGDTADDPIVVATRGQKLTPYQLVETGTDTGIFTGELTLTGFAAQDADGDGTTGDARATQSTCSTADPCGPTDGLLKADDDDGLTVSFEFTEDETVVGSALIRWNIGEVQFLEASYPATGQGVVRVVDPDMNLNPESVDSFEIDSWSDSDAGGIDLTVTETNEATGIFEGTVFFTVTDESSGHRLRVAEGDTVTAEYEDNTLPSPYTKADELEIASTTFIGSIVPPLERAPASNPRIVDAFGNELDEVSVDQQVQITADLANGQDRDQSFAYLVQIQDEDGVTVSLSWITGSLAPGQSLNPAQSWTPTSPGTYNVQIFVWESVDNPDALSPPVSTTITVS